MLHALRATSQTWIPGSSPGMTPAKVYVEKTLFFCRQPVAGPGMTKGGGIQHYLHHDLDSGTNPWIWRKFVLGRGVKNMVK